MTVVGQCGIGGLVGNHDDARPDPLPVLVDDAFLTHLGDTHVAFGEFSCHSCQYAGTGRRRSY